MFNTYTDAGEPYQQAHQYNDVTIEERYGAFQDDIDFYTDMEKTYSTFVCHLFNTLRKHNRLGHGILTDAAHLLRDEIMNTTPQHVLDYLDMLELEFLAPPTVQTMLASDISKPTTRDILTNPATTGDICL